MFSITLYDEATKETRSWTLPNGITFIGRTDTFYGFEEELCIAIPSPKIPRRLCRLTAVGDELLIADMGHTIGDRIVIKRDDKILKLGSAEAPLQHGDVVRYADVVAFIVAFTPSEKTSKKKTWLPILVVLGSFLVGLAVVWYLLST